ncbi:MAG: hypothetical protein AAB674_03040 [Patescibacteria group bacterium]
MKFSTSKLVADPILGLIDITQFLPMIDVKEFQSLAFKYQLGLTLFLFPSATHSRKQHCFGAFKRTKNLMHHWLKIGMITPDQSQTLCAYALYHDIGHGPFSHMVEPLFDLTEESKKTDLRADDAMAIEIVGGLRREVEASGINYDEFYKIFKHENPLYLVVHDKNLGSEKFDYLTRDAFYTINEIPGVDYLTRHIYFVENQLVIDEKVIDQAKAIQEFYIKMSKHVYLRKKAAILQRFVQKMAYELVKEGMSVFEIWKFTDFGLLGRFETSVNPIIRYYYDRLMSGQFPKAVLELRYEQFVKSDNLIFDKALNVFGVSEGELNKILFNKELMGLKSLADIERKIAVIAGVPEESIMITPPMSSHRFAPEDVKVYGQDGKINMLSNYYPSHFAAMVEYGRSHQMLRVCVFSEYRDKVSDNAEKIKDYILSLTK